MEINIQKIGVLRPYLKSNLYINQSFKAFFLGNTKAQHNFLNDKPNS